MFSVTLSGLNEVARNLQRIEQKLQRQAIRDALKKACEVVRASARSNVRSGSGALAKRIKIKAMRGRSKNRIGYRVTVKSPQSKSKSRETYGSFIELGTSKMAGKPFLRPALLRNRERCRAIFIFELRAALGT